MSAIMPLTERIRDLSLEQLRQMISVEHMSEVVSGYSGAHINYRLDGLLTGHALLDIDHAARKVRSFNFYPLDFTPELVGCGVGTVTFQLLLHEAVESFGVKNDYQITLNLSRVDGSFIRMLSRLELWCDAFNATAPGALYSAPFGEFYTHVDDQIRQRVQAERKQAREN